MTVPVRAALYLRVSTGRQADNDLSIPDQRRQAKGYCTSHGWEIIADYVEPGVSATDDRRPEFQRMIDAATIKPPAFDVVVVHSFSRFFRDQFQLEFYVRRLAKNGVRLVSITQELGDDPMSNMIRQIMALFDEYQSKENAKHTLRAMKENARQGFWNGSLPPIGYRIVEAAEQHGHRTKKTLDVGWSKGFTPCRFRGRDRGHHRHRGRAPRSSMALVTVVSVKPTDRCSRVVSLSGASIARYGGVPPCPHP
jgi:site-specific DNA recombinase